MLNVYTSKHLEGDGGGADSSVGQRGVVKCTAVSCVPRPPLPLLYTDRRGAGLAAAAAGWPDNCEQYRQEGGHTALPHCHTDTLPHIRRCTPLVPPEAATTTSLSPGRGGTWCEAREEEGRGGGGGDGVLVSGRGCVGDSGSCAGWRWY